MENNTNTKFYLHSLPLPNPLERLCKSLAMLDAIREPQWDLRYFSFNHQWSDGKTMASMRTGGGDEYFISFCPYGTILIGHTPKSPLNRYLYQHDRERQAITGYVPGCFAREINEPAFEAREATFFLWSVGDAPWERAQIPGVSEADYADELLFALDGDPATYTTWAAEYFEANIPMEAVRQVYDHAPLTKTIVKVLNPARKYAELVAEAREIGYPLP